MRYRVDWMSDLRRKGKHAMRAIDIMTANVRTVSPDTSIHDLAAFLCEHGISGVPVVDANGDLVGIVSEGDLLHRAELGTEKRPTGWSSRLSPAATARAYLKSHARTVEDVMTRDVITIAPMAFVDEIADLLETKGIRRLPVTRDGKLVGIVSRANLVRALAEVEASTGDGGTGDDETIRATLLAELRGKSWASVWAADIMVRDKVVHLWFADDQPVEERRALRVAAENTPGVDRVEEHLMHVEFASPM
jgi:CBS domain-containing protein